MACSENGRVFFFGVREDGRSFFGSENLLRVDGNGVCVNFVTYMKDGKKAASCASDG